MSSSDSEFVCDGCGADCGNGSVFNCLVVSDIDAEKMLVKNLHFCRSVYKADGELVKEGCAVALLADKIDYVQPHHDLPVPVETEEEVDA